LFQPCLDSPAADPAGPINPELPVQLASGTRSCSSACRAAPCGSFAIRATATLTTKQVNQEQSRRHDSEAVPDSWNARAEVSDGRWWRGRAGTVHRWHRLGVQPEHCPPLGDQDRYWCGLRRRTGRGWLHQGLFSASSSSPARPKRKLRRCHASRSPESQSYDPPRLDESDGPSQVHRA
jgi:hypothetical protein